MKNICILLIISIFCSCKKSTTNSPIDLFSVEKKLTKQYCNFDQELFGIIEGLQCNDSSLIVFDYHSGKSFTLFDTQLEKNFGRFGSIGQGPDEIPSGCYGYLEGIDFYISDNSTGLIAKYNIDSLQSNIDSEPKRLTRFQIPNAFFTQICSINDSLFLGAGSYDSFYQFVLFDKNSNVINSDVEIFNAKDIELNIYHKYLSNQGKLKKHPSLNKFVFSLKNSSNIDFIELLDNKIHLVKSIRLANPKHTRITKRDFNQMIPTKDCKIGYIDIATSKNYIYALYTDKKKIGEDGKGNASRSNTILVFDWDGNPIYKYLLEEEVYFIATNENGTKLYAAIIMDNNGWNIISYDL